MTTPPKATAKRGGRKPKAAETPAAAETAQEPTRRRRGRTAVPPATFSSQDESRMPEVLNGTAMEAPNGTRTRGGRRRAAPVTVTRQPPTMPPPAPSKSTQIAASALTGGDNSRLQWVDSNTVIIMNKGIGE
jgi:hypothetical protein